MGVLIYNLLVRSYNFAISLYGVINNKARLLVNGRKNALKTIREKCDPQDEVIWMHCASLGEFEQGLPVLEEIKNEFPEYKICISFFSPSGYEVKKNIPLAGCVVYLPADTKSKARRFIKLLNPKIAIFVKYEFWYHYIKTCFDNNIPIISISTILRNDQVFFKPYGGFYRKMLLMITHFFVQNEQTKNLLAEIGIQSVTISGDTRFDRVSDIAKNHKKIEKIENFKGSDPLIILGSSWIPDIDLWIPYINENPQIKFIIAPHNIAPGELTYVEKKITLPSVRFSNLTSTIQDAQVIIIDNIGLLSSLYYYADIAYVGGAFGEGLHNILEPAVFGIPVIFAKSKGNNKFHEATELVNRGGGFEVLDSQDLRKILTRLFSDHQFYTNSCLISENYVAENLGSTQKIMNSVKNILK